LHAEGRLQGHLHAGDALARSQGQDVLQRAVAQGATGRDCEGLGYLPRRPMAASCTGGGGGAASTTFFTRRSSLFAVHSSRALAYLGVPGCPGTVAHSSGVISAICWRYFPK